MDLKANHLDKSMKAVCLKRAFEILRVDVSFLERGVFAVIQAQAHIRQIHH